MLMDLGRNMEGPRTDMFDPGQGIRTWVTLKGNRKWTQVQIGTTWVIYDRTQTWTQVQIVRTWGAK